MRDLWPVRADVGQFEQVIINLAVNARDAMPLGGKLTLRTSNVSVGDDTQHWHKDMPADDYVLAEVEDTGSGIAPEIIDKIFDPFYTTKDVGKGTGLGLSTVYGIVKQTGGFIYVESEVGKGAIFRIFLPRHVPAADEVEVPQLPETTAPAIATAAAGEIRAPATDLTGLGTILLVEDEEGLRALNARGLQSRGYTVIEAGNGIEALQELEKQGGDGRACADERTQEAQARHQDHLRVWLCRGRLRQKPPRSDAVQFPPQAVHAQAIGQGGEGDHGGLSGVAVSGAALHFSFPLRRIREALFSLGTFARYHPSMIEPEQTREDKYVETARERRIANAVLLFFLLVVVGGGIWLANAMFEQRRLEDCMAQGRGNCAPPIETPAR